MFTGEKIHEKALGLYLHVPFCKKICDYCDFHAFSAPEWLFLEYLELVSRELEIYGRRHPHIFEQVKTLYVGGGTPSVLPPELLMRLFSLLRGVGVPLRALRECTMEFNPESCDSERIAVAVECGVNRASLGLQTLSQDLLDRVGRRHTVDAGKQALSLLMSHGGLRVNADLMFNLPGQSMERLAQDVEWLASTGVGHVSFYGLKVDPDKRLGRRIARGEESVDEDLYPDMYRKGVEILESHGLARYETSNFAREGEESLHNLNYWRGGEYLAFGPGAHGYVAGVRFYAPEMYARWREYVRRGCPDELLTRDLIGREEALAELVQLSLRTKYGLDLQTLQRMGSGIPDKVIQKWVSQGFAEVLDGHLRLVGDGWLFMDSVVLDLYSNME